MGTSVNTGAADGAAPDSAFDIRELAGLVIVASRLIGGLANLPIFKNADVSLAEWLALSVISDKAGVSNKLLARHLGVTGQRANQLCTSLEQARLISVTHAEEDSRRNVIRITDAGQAQIESLNAQLQAIVADALRGKRRSLTIASKQMRLMLRMVQAGTPETAPKRSKKEEQSRKGQATWPEQSGRKEGA
jgi:DNA-binding MarR family transcriptional regulator